MLFLGRGSPVSRADLRMPMAEKEKTMTEVDAAAYCLYEAISGAETFGKTQADKVKEVASNLLATKKIDTDVFASVIMRFGNHSATRQRLEKFGWFSRKVAQDAMEIAMRKLESEATDPEKQ